MGKWRDRLLNPRSRDGHTKTLLSYLRSIVTGGLYNISTLKTEDSFSNIEMQIKTMRALARDSQISTALSYYATDATTPNTAGKIIWATAKPNLTGKAGEEIAEVINSLFQRWKVDSYARDHILELATIGNLYIPTTDLYKDPTHTYSRRGIALDNNTIPDPQFDIFPGYKIPPENILHLYDLSDPIGYIMQPDSDVNVTHEYILPESACIHFSLGGLLGDYTISGRDKDGNDVAYDIKFAQPLMANAVQPTQTLSLLEDAIVLSSLARTIKIIAVECGAEEEEIDSALLAMKQTIEQNIAINTNSGDIQSFVNPQSPNNLIYVPKVNGANPIDITDLNMADSNDSDSKLLQYYQDKKLSVLGVPKEAMNFSSNEGLGGAGAVLSQRSAIYANALSRITTAYMAGWTDALNKYFTARNLTGFVDTFELHMNPIITLQSTVQFDKRDAALNQASTLIGILKDLKIDDKSDYKAALTEILSEVFPQIGANVNSWHMDVTPDAEGGDSGEF